MSNIKYLIEDLKDGIETHGFLRGIWYSDLLDPVYRLVNLPSKIVRYLSKFYYYGKVGASQTVDFDSSGIDSLIYCHIKKVRKFMDSKRTSSSWNSDRKKGLIRKLYEFEELCKRKVQYDDFNDHYNLIQVLDKYGRGKKVTVRIGKSTGYRYQDSLFVKKLRKRAIEKDRCIAEQRRKRYYYMLEHYVPSFWD